jgi:hypothetical protein
LQQAQIGFATTLKLAKGVEPTEDLDAIEEIRCNVIELGSEDRSSKRC